MNSVALDDIKDAVEKHYGKTEQIISDWSDGRLTIKCIFVN